MELKNRIPDEKALEAVILSDIQGTTREVKKEIGHLEGEYIKYRRKQRLLALSVFAILFLPSMFFFVFGSLLSATVSSWSAILGTVIFFLSLCVFIYVAGIMVIKGSVVVKAFHGGIDKILFNKMFALLGVDGALIVPTIKIDKRVFPNTTWGKFRKALLKYMQSIAPSPEAEAMLGTLRQSELITEPFNTTKVDNLFRIMSSEGSRELLAGELDIKNVTGSGKNRQVKHIFKGYFVSYQLPHTLDAKTFISTEGDESGFGHVQFWSLAKESLPTETVLEWSEFEDMLHVATTDKVEARYILAPNFMSDLYDWWKSRKGNIRISFINDRMYMLFPDNQVRIEETVSHIDEAEVKNYMLTMARPLLHILHLIEDVRMA